VGGVNAGRDGTYFRSILSVVGDRAAAALRISDPRSHELDLLATALEKGVKDAACYEQNPDTPLYEPVRDLDRFDDLSLSAIALGRSHHREWKLKIGEPAYSEKFVVQAENAARARGITVGDHQEHSIRVAAHHCVGCGHLEDCRILRPECPVGGGPTCVVNCGTCRAWISALRAIR
jgi:hypothetical protein